MTHRIFILSSLLSLWFIQTNGQFSAENQSVNNYYQSKRIKYHNITEISLGFGLGNSNGHSSIGLRTVNGVIINSTLGIGIGLGADRLSIASNVNPAIVQIGPDIRMYFLRILILALDGGYIYNLTGYYQGYRTGLDGFYYNPSLGIKIISFKDHIVHLNIGVKIQKNTINYVNMALPEYEKFINLKAAIQF